MPTVTFGSSTNAQIKFDYTVEPFDASTISSSNPYGITKIYISNLQAKYNGNDSNLRGKQLFLSFKLNFNGEEVHTFRSGLGNWYFNSGSSPTWVSVTGSGVSFPKTLSYRRTTTSAETVRFSISKYVVGADKGFGNPALTNFNAQYCWIGGSVHSGGYGPGEQTVTINLPQSYSNPSPPTYVGTTSISGESAELVQSEYYVIPDKRVRIYWYGASNGIDNPINNYRLYISRNGGSYSATSYYSTSTTTISGKGTCYYCDVTISGSGGDYLYFEVQAIGRYSNSSLSSGVSGTSHQVIINRRPYTPGGGVAYIPSNVNSAWLSYGLTIDPDDTEISYYYATSPTGVKREITGQVAPGTYYIWTYDGLQFSENYAQSSIIKARYAPTVEAISITPATYTPYYREEKTGYTFIYAESAKLKVDTVKSDTEYYAIPKQYNYYIKEAFSLNELESLNFELKATVEEKEYNLIPSKSGSYYQIGVSVTTGNESYFEEGPIKFDDTIYCSHRGINADDFKSLVITTDSLINNSRGTISDASDLQNLFSKYIKITWTNPSITVIRNQLTSIECGFVNNSGNFSKVDTLNAAGQNIIPNKTRGATNTVFLNISSSVIAGAIIKPAIRINPERGSSFIIQGAARTKVQTLSIPSGYKATPPLWNFFNDNTISFSGNKIIGDGSFATISSVSIFNNLNNRNYSGTYIADGSSTPGHINFNDFSTFKSNIQLLGYDKQVNCTYTISVTDRYGNMASTTIVQQIDFRVAPTWPSNAALSTSVYYLTNNTDSYTQINNSTTANKRILNPGEKIKISWTAATDSGNGNSSNIKYTIIAYKKEATNTLDISGGKQFFSTQTSNNSYIYTIPYGNTKVESIYFIITATDQSGLSTTSNLSTSTNMALAIGRAVAPAYEINGFIIDSTGKLSGKLVISDYGDSRNIQPTWDNYTRLGLIFKESNNTITNSATNDYSFTNIGSYPTSGKVILSFNLYPNKLVDLISTKSYIFSFDGPTFSYRSHQIGINVEADAYSDTVLIVGGSGEKNKIKLITTKVNWDDIYFSLNDAKIHNLIIDGGDW